VLICALQFVEWWSESDAGFFSWQRKRELFNYENWLLLPQLMKQTTYFKAVCQFART